MSDTDNIREWFPTDPAFGRIVDPCDAAVKAAVEAERAACTEELRLAVAAAKAQAVRVKPLVWHNFDAFTYWSESTSGTYRVEERLGWWRCTLNLPRIEHLIYEYKSDGSHDNEAVKAAAQADHEARILAALE